MGYTIWDGTPKKADELPVCTMEECLGPGLAHRKNGDHEGHHTGKRDDEKSGGWFKFDEEWAIFKPSALQIYTFVFL